jgi:hypothetical protein
VLKVADIARAQAHFKGEFPQSYPCHLALRLHLSAKKNLVTDNARAVAFSARAQAQIIHFLLKGSRVFPAMLANASRFGFTGCIVNVPNLIFVCVAHIAPFSYFLPAIKIMISRAVTAQPAINPSQKVRLEDKRSLISRSLFCSCSVAISTPKYEFYTMCTLMSTTSKYGVPFIVRYTDDLTRYCVIPISYLAKEVLPKLLVMGELEYVTFLYKLRRREVPVNVVETIAQRVAA